MKTVCVSTYCDWDNYGSMLQALGLKNCLKSMGYESFVSASRQFKLISNGMFNFKHSVRKLFKIFK